MGKRSRKVLYGESLQCFTKALQPSQTTQSPTQAAVQTQPTFPDLITGRFLQVGNRKVALMFYLKLPDLRVCLSWCRDVCERMYQGGREKNKLNQRWELMCINTI